VIPRLLAIAQINQSQASAGNFRRLSLRAATALKAEQQLRQLRHIDRNPPRLVAQYLSF
jgi:hypothetical protein